MITNTNNKKLQGDGEWIYIYIYRERKCGEPKKCKQQWIKRQRPRVREAKKFGV